MAINGHMLHWLAKTDGQDGDFIKANRHPSGGNCFVVTTPSGKKLAGGNGSGGAADALTRGLAEWNKLSDAERKALPEGKAATAPQAPQAPQAALCKPPAGGLILKSYIRNLKENADGTVVRILPEDLKDRTAFPDWNPVYIEPQRFNLWLTEKEWKSLVPEAPRAGDRFPVPDGIRQRLVRFHLVNGTFGLPGAWRRADIRAAELSLTVEAVKPEAVKPVLRMRLEGAAFLATDAEPSRANRGYDARLLGSVEYDTQKQAFTRFDLIALGDYWGGDYEGGRFKRPGRTPLGIAFELVRDRTAVDLVPPRVHMDRKQEYDRYFAAERD